MSLTNKALLYAVNERSNCCCLCFQDVGENSHFIKDAIFLELIHPEISIEVFKIMSCVFGVDVLEYITMADKVCALCMESLIKSYVFIKVCKRNFQILSNILNNLTLNISITEKFSDFSTLFIELDKNQSPHKFYYDRKQSKSPGEAMTRFKLIVSENSGLSVYKPYSEIKSRNIHRKVKPRNQFIPLTEIACGGALLKCKTCFKVYSSATELKRHYVKMHAPKIYSCSECTRCFGSSSLLEDHKSESHCTLVCTECGKTYHNRTTFRLHELSHKLKIMCHNCGKLFQYKRTFRRHNKKNECQQKFKQLTSDRFICDICNKQYSKKGSLRVHIEYYHGNRQAHVCPWCQKKFHAQSMLKSHVVTHTKEKNFDCNMCGAKFVTKRSLLYHTRLHTGEKPYACEHCDKSFLSASRRLEHVRREHMGPTLECDICCSKFKTGGSLRSHKKKHFNPNSKLYCAQNVYNVEIK